MVTEMIDKLELGIIYDKAGKIINHRSFVKVIFNPILRIFGVNIATEYDPNKNKLYKPVIIQCRKNKNIDFLYRNDNEYIIKKERMFI